MRQRRQQIVGGIQYVMWLPSLRLGLYVDEMSNGKKDIMRGKLRKSWKQMVV